MVTTHQSSGLGSGSTPGNIWEAVVGVFGSHSLPVVPPAGPGLCLLPPSFLGPSTGPTHRPPTATLPLSLVPTDPALCFAPLSHRLVPVGDLGYTPGPDGAEGVVDACISQGQVPFPFGHLPVWVMPVVGQHAICLYPSPRRRKQSPVGLFSLLDYCQSNRL